MNPVIVKTASQNLASAALSHSYTVDVESALLDSIYIHASQNITETVTIVLKSIVDTTNRVYELGSQSLSAADDYRYKNSGGPDYLRKGDIILITCTNNNTAGTVYSEIRLTEKEY